MIDELLARFRQGDRLALARLLTLIARGQELAEISAALPPPGKPARVMAVTGSAGAGKSTLVGKLIDIGRKHQLRVAVLACDPESPLTGGALLGDRFRMAGGTDDGVFIRSLATTSGRGAIANHIDLMIQLLEAFGFDVILMETVGAGQGDTAVHALADTVLLLVQPETGDDLQWEKAGLLEVADIVAIHKADLPGAEQAAAQARASLDLTNQKQTPVLKVSSRTGEGLALLWDALLAQPLRRNTQRNASEELLQAAQSTLADRYAKASANPDLVALTAQWQVGEVSREEATSRLLQLLFGAMSKH